MNVTTWENYFRKFITVQLVNSMYQIDLLDLDTAMKDLRSGKYAPDNLVLESFTVNTDVVHADDIYDIFYGAVLVLTPAPIRTLDQAAKTTILNSTYTKTATIKRTMIFDKYHSCDVMRGLVVESMQIEKLGPVLDNMYGWRLMFQIDIPLTDPLA